MELTISSELTIKEPTPELAAWARENLVFANPEYTDRRRRGLWTGGTPEYLTMYATDGGRLILPCGTGKKIKPLLDGCIIRQDLADNGELDYGNEIPLYDYQGPAVGQMEKAGCGILQSPCGSGKTQMGLALAGRISRKTLWVTHTQDLLNQSHERAAQYFDKKLLGKITGGKVSIGSHITFATVQTLSKLDLQKYKYEWDVVIVDECHRLCGTPSKVTMFSKIIGSLAARYKYGLSATVHRADGLINTTFALIGDVACRVPEEAVKDKTVPVKVIRRCTGVTVSRDCQDTDGTLDYSKLIPYLTGHPSRNGMIVQDLANNGGCSSLVLSDRLEHLRAIREMLPEQLRGRSSMIDGSMTSKRARAERAMAIEDMRTGKKDILFASYSLAKEGLDIPRLDRLYMTTPKKDYAVVTQSIGRVSRAYCGKGDAICYDYVDSIQFCENQYKRRKAHYRKAGCEIVE